MPNDVPPGVSGVIVVRTTITLDDELVAAAQDYTGLKEKSALVNAALKALVEREAARRLARLGGSQPDLKPVRRRRSKVS
jgi:Arc/MetJ family transcription regulator